MKLWILTLGLFLVTAVLAGAQSTPESLVNKFFDTYLAQGTSAALDQFYATNKWMDRNKDATEKLKSQFANLPALVGDYYGRDLIAKKTLGESFVLISYLVKYDRQPIRFTFELYKPQDSWLAYSFSYDDSFGDELEEAAKVHNLDDDED